MNSHRASLELDAITLEQITKGPQSLRDAAFSLLLDPNCSNELDGNAVNRNRITSIHRNKSIGQTADMATSCTFGKTLECRRRWMNPAAEHEASVEQRASSIANRMQQDTSLMASTLESELLRREALRDMPQGLTIKRLVKKKLYMSVEQNAKNRSVYRRMKQGYNTNTSKAQSSIKSLIYSFELWYSSLKTIEGHFGSGVATYFKFFRWLFLMNVLIMLVVFVFIVIPQLLYRNKSSDVKSYDQNNKTVLTQSQPLDNNEVNFEILDVFTGEGYFTNSTFYYGYYINNSINITEGQTYSVPYSYFFTMLFVYVGSFVILSASMAKSYRKSFIETKGGLKNIYAHKVFCSWDYSIATREAASLKTSSIYQELKELLSESVKYSISRTVLQKFWTFVLQCVIHVLIVGILAGTGYLMWYLLQKHGFNINNPSSSLDIVIPILISLIMLIFPSIFSFIVRYEDYKHPRAALYVTLIRTFLLEIVILGVFLTFWLTHSTNENCWETEIGQHIYRLILFNFLFSVLISATLEACRFLIYKYYSKKIGLPECDIARYTLQLIYNQTLLWVGLYFAPLLSVVVVIELWLTWYIRRTCVLYFCRPARRSWRAAQTHTWFLILSFLSLFLVVITYGYIIANVPASNCGPFREYRFMYEMILKGILKLEQNNVFWKIFMYSTKPGTVALILVAMCVIVYYLRAKASSQIDMVRMLREMLVLEAKDKEFLMKNISLVAEEKWQYKFDEVSNDMRNLLNHSFRRNLSNLTDSCKCSTPSSSSENLSDNSLLRSAHKRFYQRNN